MSTAAQRKAHEEAKRAAAPNLSTGTKLDTGKTRLDLLPPDALMAAAGVFTFGAEKYAERNWEKGMDWGRVFAAQQRHMMAFWGGEMYDPETGMLHTAHAQFGTMVLTSYALRGIGNDTRSDYAAANAGLVQNTTDNSYPMIWTP